MNSAVWIDLQVNGYAGVDFNAPGLTVEAVKAVTERLEADGTCGYLPTLVTGDPEMLCMEVLRARTGITEEECRAIGHDNPLALIGIT